VNVNQEFIGGTRFAPMHESGPHTLLVAVPCHVGGLPQVGYGLLDTAAEWCVLPPSTADLLGVADMEPEDPVRLSTRLGVFDGHRVRLPVEFPADVGVSLTVPATFFVSADWPGPLVVGWRGCLERMRFALDPTEEAFYFAAP
jgi:hypothetical protein